MKKYIVTLLLLGSIKAYAQTNHTTNFYLSSLKYFLWRSAGTSAMRPNHFPGLDFLNPKHNWQEIGNCPAGSISNYGNTWFGIYTSMFITVTDILPSIAILSGFVNPIADAIEAYQYERSHGKLICQSFNNTISRNTGQQIAWSRNTGYSMGPHLHLDPIEDSTVWSTGSLPFLVNI